jgi:hypothetical protein
MSSIDKISSGFSRIKDAARVKDQKKKAYRQLDALDQINKEENWKERQERQAKKPEISSKISYTDMLMEGVLRPFNSEQKQRLIDNQRKEKFQKVIEFKNHYNKLYSIYHAIEVYHTYNRFIFDENRSQGKDLMSDLQATFAAVDSSLKSLENLFSGKDNQVEVNASQKDKISCFANREDEITHFAETNLSTLHGIKNI